MRKELFRFLIFIISLLVLPGLAERVCAQQIIAYYSGSSKKLNKYPVKKCTEIIFSFCHLKGNRLAVDNKKDTATIKDLVRLKKKNQQIPNW